ncbi:MAG TPA: hypothetical protein VEL74_07070 [Thermoanaerobaculia bacterium]|nr:hypothetical protein [Thermoanaerobaculia bacterium]
MSRDTRQVFCGRLFLAILILVSTGGAARAQCPSGTFVIDLTTGQSFPTPPPGRITVMSLGPTANPHCDAGWQSAVLRLDLAPPCHEAEITVDFDQPIAWTVHIADSPTSDGYGGDAGTTPNNAEMWINQQAMWVTSNRTGGVTDNNLYQENLNLNYGAMKFAVKNHWLSWGTPLHVLNMVGTKKLFALPDTSNPAEAYFLYVGLNRVVADLPLRSGCGAQRAMITIE